MPRGRGRGTGGKWKRPCTNVADRPPGLRGKAIGLYYKNKQKAANKNKYCIRLEVPETVVAALHENIQEIEYIAKQENIYLEPVKMLNFDKPKPSFGADFIPLVMDDKEKQSHLFSNIFPRDNDVIFVSKDESKAAVYKPIGEKENCISKYDVDDENDDVIYVKAEKSEPMVISDDSNEAVALDGFHSKKLLETVKVKCEDTKAMTDQDKAVDIDRDVKPIKTEKVTDSSMCEALFDVNKEEKVIKSEIKPDIKPVIASGSNLDDEFITDNTNEFLKPIISKLKCKETDYESSGYAESTSSRSQSEATGKDYKYGFDDIITASGTSSDDEFLTDNKNEFLKPIISKFKAQGTDYPSSRFTASTSSHGQTEATGKDYKYGYDDIITGTFEEKLDESLSKGINININNAATDVINKNLLKEYNIMLEDKKYQEMNKFRQILPTFKKTKDLLDVINNNQVVVISGETGCGKSTQVPQIILDDAIKNNRGANVKILVTEPRRIAASSLTMRVAEERAESMGKSVGYAVRLERVDCRPRGSIMFCTTGVLLVELEVNQSLSNYSHIILDEVHERDCQIDIAMCMLRQVLKKRKDLKLILMSATIDSERLCAYYDDCPMLKIEGLAYPVRDVYLEEILHMTRYQLPPVLAKGPIKPIKPWMKYVRGNRFSAAEEMEKDIQYKAEIGPWLESIKKNLDPDVYRTLQDSRIEELDLNLIFLLLLCISRNEPGAILVFLPGIADITKLIKIMRETRQFPETHFEIHPLHSKLPTLTQHKIFKRPRGDVRKIIVATNIAETSITIDDIVYVVDCARIKYKGLNVQDHVSTLQTEWASQANLRQRRGRAGRCQAGICYHLVSSYRASKLPERLQPELQRDDLLEPVLQIKRLRLGYAEQALALMPAEPHVTTIRNAVRHLQQCGALNENETLTPLGWHLARLPVHPAAGKLLLLGALFGCLERAASVAAVWGFKDPFHLVIGKEKEVEEAKKNLALGEPSDHITMSEAIIQWENCKTQSEKYSFCRDYFLSMSTLGLLSEMKRQFGQNLKQMGFLQSGDVKSIWENRNADNLALFKAIVAASLYPNIGTVKWRNLHSRNPHKRPCINVKTPEEPIVSIHPSSVMFTQHDQNQRRKQAPLPICSNPGANWLVYWLKQRSTKLYLIEVTLVYTLPLLFFGELKVTQAERADECYIDIKTIRVRCNKETTQLLFQLRTLLDQVLASKIMASGERKRSSTFEEHVLNAVKRLITAEDARTDYLDDDDDDQHDSDDFNDGRKW